MSGQIVMLKLVEGEGETDPALGIHRVPYAHFIMASAKHQEKGRTGTSCVFSMASRQIFATFSWRIFAPFPRQIFVISMVSCSVPGKGKFWCFSKKQKFYQYLV